MKREAEINEMFVSMREEKPEVSVKKVHKWLGISGGVVLSVYLLSWIKRVLFLKPVLMISSVIALGSLAFVTVFSSGKVSAENQVEMSVQQEVKKPVNEQKQQTTHVTPVSNEDRAAVVPESPLTLPLNPLEEISQEREMQLSPLAPLPVVQMASIASEVDDFSKLTVGSAFKVVLKQGNICAIDIQGTEEEKGNVSYTVKDHHLKIVANCKGKKNCELPDKIVITMKDVKRLDVSGACDFDVEGTLKCTEEIALLFSGAAQIDMKLESPSIDCKVSGAVDLEIEGSTKKLELQTSGAANIEADELKAEEVRVLASGATNTSVYGSKELKLIVSGASHVNYSGSGTLAEKAVSGASSVKKK